MTQLTQPAPQEQPVETVPAPPVFEPPPPIEKTKIPKIPKIPGLSKYSLPTLGSIESVKQHIITSEAADVTNAMEFTMENLAQEWEAYASGVSSPSLQGTMRRAILSIEDTAIYAKVGSSMAQDFIRKELPLTKILRAKFNIPGLTLLVQIDESLAQVAKVQVKKALTVKDRYDSFVKANPLVEELRQRFDLKLDQ